MRDKFVTDTMALVLRLEKRRSPQPIRQIFEGAECGQFNIYIPAIVLAEIGYLSERKRIDITLKDVFNYCITYPNIQITPLTKGIISSSFDIDDINELHDRLIAGTALNMKLSLLTNDPVISSSKHISVIWNNSKLQC